MAVEDQVQALDLRMLTLLHAMRDIEGFVQEARRIKESQIVDDPTWRHICDLGKELNILFEVEGRSFDHGVDAAHSRERRKTNRRVQNRRTTTDRRKHDRRTTVVLWLGPERRERERRQYARRRMEKSLA